MGEIFNGFKSKKEPEILHQSISKLFELKYEKHVVGEPLGNRFVDATQLGKQLNGLANGQIEGQTVELRTIAEMLACQVLVRLNAITVYDDVATIRINVSSDHAKRGCLASAIHSLENKVM